MNTMYTVYRWPDQELVTVSGPVPRVGDFLTKPADDDWRTSGKKWRRVVEVRHELETFEGCTTPKIKVYVE